MFPSGTGTIRSQSLPCWRVPIRYENDSTRIVTMLPWSHPKRARFTPNRYLVTVLPSKTGTIHSESLPCYRASIQNGHDSLRIVTLLPCFHPKRARFDPIRNYYSMSSSIIERQIRIRIIPVSSPPKLYHPTRQKKLSRSR